MAIAFPGESAEYRTERNRLLEPTISLGIRPIGTLTALTWAFDAP